MDIIKSLITLTGLNARPDTQRALQDAQAALAKSDEAKANAIRTQLDSVAHMYLTEALVHEQRAANLIALASLGKQLGL